MANHIFKGSGVAIVTPMFEDGSVNYDEYGRLIEFQINNGTDAIIACGTTGESATLNREEHCQVIEYTVNKVAKRVPVIAGAGSNDTFFAAELSAEAERLGADAILSVTPYYNKTSQAGLVKHYNYIADRIHIPMIVYNVPSRTGCNIKPETYAELSKHPNIQAAKEANGDISALVKTMSLCGDNLDIYSGEDAQTFSIISMGGLGVISVFANVCPRESHEMAKKALDGDFKSSFAMQKYYVELINMLFSDVNPIPIKTAMNMCGFNCGPCRMPLTSMSEAGEKALRECLVKYGILKAE